MKLGLSFLLAACAGLVQAQKVEVSEASGIYFPGVADSNSPLHWHAGKRYVFNSDGHPIRSEGAELQGMRYARTSHLLNSPVLGWWIEATYRDDDGTLFAWYHHETFGDCPADSNGYMLAKPVIGAAVSRDNGHSFQDLGFVLTDGYPANCDAKNGYFSGGHGDFSVILDKDKKYFYFFFSTYAGPPKEQGVAIARLPYDLRFEQAGNVQKYREGAWESPGIGGQVTPIFSVRTPWESEWTDAYWGPSIHYNRELEEYVVLLNRACCEPGWPPHEIAIAFSGDLANPKSWSEPAPLFDGGGWYPMVVGLDEGDTDKSAGARARLFVGSDSFWELTFRKGQDGVSVWSDERRRKEPKTSRGEK